MPSLALPAAPARPHIPASPAVQHKHRLRGQLSRVTLAWVFGSIWLFTISGAAMTQFAKALGTPDYAFGILAALPFLGTFMQIPASYLQQRYGWRKPLFMFTAVIGRLMWVVAAAVPWFMPDARAWWWPTMTLALLISWLTLQSSAPSWMSWMSDVIPRRLRGRYFARRNLIGRPIGMLAALLVGEALDMGLHVAGHQPDIILKMTSAILAIGGLLGAMDILLFRKVDDPNPPKPKPDAAFWSTMRRPLHDANFRVYLAFNFTFILAIGFIGQYLWLYLFDVCHWTNRKANLLAMVVPLAATMLTYRMWGRLIDRFGKKPILLITGAAISFGSLGWLLVTEHSLLPGYALILLVMLFWPGMEIANFNFILGMAGGKDEHGHDVGPAYVTLNSIVIAIGGVLSGLLAAVVARYLKDMQYILPLIGLTLTYHGVLFLLSTVLRLTSLIFAARLHEPSATGTRDAFRYMTTTLYSNVRQAALAPTAVVGRLTRFAYRMSFRR